jgi:threonyl-tRNA synthetase
MQYDPNLPERFDLAYTGQDGKDHRPVMLHRAVFGTMERFLSVYLEHCAGNFPTWIAPMQAIILTVSDKTEAYGRELLAEMKAKGYRVEADFSGDKLGAKIRNARGMKHPYMLIVGPKDAEAGTVSVRSRDAGELGAMPREQLYAKLTEESSPPTS